MTDLCKSLNFDYIVDITYKLQKGQITSKQFHNKKYYSARKGDLFRTIELTIAWELHKGNYNFE